MKSNNIIDKFLLVVFSASKVLSAIVVALCLLVALFTGLGLLFGGGQSLDIPDFKVVQSSLEENTSPRNSNAEDYIALDKKREIEKKFGDDINDIIKEYKLPAEVYGFCVSNLLKMDEDYRGKFIDGLDEFLGEAQKYIKKQGDKSRIELLDSVSIYVRMFDRAINEVQESEIAAESEKIYSWGILGGSIIILLAFIFVPLLIQIEQNTRKEKADGIEDSQA